MDWMVLKTILVKLVLRNQQQFMDHWVMQYRCSRISMSKGREFWKKLIIIWQKQLPKKTFGIGRLNVTGGMQFLRQWWNCLFMHHGLVQLWSYQTMNGASMDWLLFAYLLWTTVHLQRTIMAVYACIDEWFAFTMYLQYSQQWIFGVSTISSNEPIRWRLNTVCFHLFYHWHILTVFMWVVIGCLRFHMVSFQPVHGPCDMVAWLVELCIWTQVCSWWQHKTRSVPSSALGSMARCDEVWMKPPCFMRKLFCECVWFLVRCHFWRFRLFRVFGEKWWHLQLDLIAEEQTIPRRGK